MCRLKKFIIGENKKKSEFEQYKKLYSKYLNMDKQKFDFEYIKLKTEYEHKKNVMAVFIVAVVLRDYRTGLYCVTKCCKARNYRLF